MPPNSTSETNKVSRTSPAQPQIAQESPQISTLRLEELHLQNEGLEDQTRLGSQDTGLATAKNAGLEDQTRLGSQDAGFAPTENVEISGKNADSDCGARLRGQDTSIAATQNATQAEEDEGFDYDELEHHHHHHHDHDYEYKFSFKQMYLDTLNLDWSKVLWDMVLSLVVFHILAFYGCYLFVTMQMKWQSVLFLAVYAYSAGLGVTMGVHRLWTHKAFKARWPVRLALMLMNSIAFQESIYLWSQNHRVHHKWSDTDRDFTNSRRGFFFAHMGWKMYETHPEVIKGRKMVDCSDLLADPFVRIQHEYYYYISLPMAFIIPTLVPYYCWGEDFWVAFLTCACFRLAITFHTTWCINSVAHLYGYKPYDKSLHAYENTFLGPFALGEGWHNYHHSFPRDYRASEIDGWGANLTTKIIELLSTVGLTYDLRTVTDDHVNMRITRTGDQPTREALLRSRGQHLDAAQA